ncbi:hypothetical protein BLA60_11490 [Actinophytocola xinjiangensis]|uniref:Uncharacterized protein n=1 Tax=Actinophytocola xinjiangensis TaxID=485602 RepID=A0A7Z1B0C9_9PSEU|nr:hypothetical protein [Actinophytocola xinjiangensis]OLF11759.1 hypothetical protein BLA60_11490 [Actinophytocola xinjiangensis]
MNFSVTDLVAELKNLRKGRGIQAPHIVDRIGPAMRAVCAITENDDAASVRQKVAARLRDLSAKLPPDLQIGVTAAFGLDDTLHTPFYKDRLRWAEDELERNTRTVRRRIDEAIVQLAELAVHRMAANGLPGQHSASSRWYNADIRQVLVLDQGSAHAMEQRRIVADEDGVSELDLALTVPTPDAVPGDRPTEVTIDVLYGGRLLERRMESTERIGYRLALPRPLRLGDEHEFALRALPRRELAPHYVCLPRHRCDRCEVRVRFDLDRRPTRLERLDGVYQRDIVDPRGDAQPVGLDACGEVAERFTNLTPGLAYGLRWTFGD